MNTQSFFNKQQVAKKVILLFVTMAILLSSCKKFLDAKTDKKLVVPESLQDVQALLDSYSLLNAYYPSIGGQSDDDFYLLYNYWNSLSIFNQNNYVWEKESYNNNEWQYLYQMVLYTNISLETLEKISSTANNLNDWKRIKGAALFFRAYAFFQVAQFYAIPYDKNTASQSPGIPLRLSSDVNFKTQRSTLQEAYDQVIKDYKDAIQLLPVVTAPISRPSKAAAYAALSRTYLTMENYEMAGKFADSCLQLYSVLIDYNALDTNSTTPFTMFNKEVIFPSRILGTGMLSVDNWKVDSILYRSYDQNDLRRALFYKSNGSSTFGFKGNYDGTTSSTMFNGIAVDEIYLIRAECKARLGDKDSAMSDLNTLLIKRWKTSTFSPYIASNKEEALQKVLTERRKELASRCLRWFDLRRLNKNPLTQKTLVRVLNGQIYQLPPNDPRYTQYIPLDIIGMTGMQQNKR